MTKPLVLIIDDESKIRKLLAANLEYEDFETYVCSNATQAIGLLTSKQVEPDVILLDLMMPQMDGMTFLKKLRKFSNTPVIIVTAKDDRPSLLEGFREGADDYITKPFYIDELLERIRAVLRRSSIEKGNQVQKQEKTILRSGKLILDLDQRKCQIEGASSVHLTNREFLLLAQLMRKPGTVFTHEQLLRSVWGEEFIGEVQYLRVAFTRIRKKLEQAGLKGSLISSYSSVGYILTEL